MEQAKRIGIYALLILNLALIAGFWWSGSSRLIGVNTASTLLAWGRVLGLLAVFGILMQVMTIGRAPWIERVFGLDKLSRVHKWNGYATLAFVVAHPVLITFSYAKMLRTGIVSQFTDFLLNYKDLLPAALAVLTLIGIVILSITIVRRRMKYETWYFVHLLTYGAVILAFGHQLSLGGDFLGNPVFSGYWYFLYVFVFGNLLLFRFAKPLWQSYAQGFRVQQVAPETHDTSSVLITGKNPLSLHGKPGQFFKLRFLQKGFWWQDHPFSISAIPTKEHLRFTIKRSGDYTSMIPKLKKGAPVIVDGPYGVFTAEPKQGAKYLFIAGGVGITPIRALLEQLAPTNDVMLIYGNKTSKDVIFRKELDELASRHHFPIHYVMSDEHSHPGERGNVDKEKLARLVPDIASWESYICGPPPMLKGVRKALRALGVRNKRIHFEKFSL